MRARGQSHGRSFDRRDRVIGPDGTFGIAGGDDGQWVPLHRSIDGWVEALPLAYAAMDVADTVTRLTGSAVGQLDLTAMQPMSSGCNAATTSARGWGIG
ncbi:hypothetical protein AAFH96_36285 [Polymorphospora sp. 2-325]|uniref:Uncharacterized protein n=1 Tax=Polymorphospora lycopeni TaxID=3140240 RepID=A0ABV5D694_9ACTN